LQEFFDEAEYQSDLDIGIGQVFHGEGKERAAPYVVINVVIIVFVFIVWGRSVSSLP
jgi:hypothetical protein